MTLEDEHAAAERAFAEATFQLIGAGAGLRVAAGMMAAALEPLQKAADAYDVAYRVREDAYKARSAAADRLLHRPTGVTESIESAADGFAGRDVESIWAGGDL